MILDDLFDYLVAQGFASTVHKGWLRELPANAVTLRETGGFPSRHVMTAGAGQAIVEEPTVQVVTRAATYDAASAMACSAYLLLDGLRNLTINGEDYHFVTAMQPPFLLERDANHRFLFAFNVHVTRRTVP